MGVASAVDLGGLLHGKGESGGYRAKAGVLTGCAERRRLPRLFNQSQKIMKTKSMLALVPVICAALAVAQAPPNYTAAEAAKHVGETATVKDKVDGVHPSATGHIFLNLGGTAPHQSFPPL